ncbi:D-alanyl-D-alanine carboxypeptidase family protein [uncultured Corynebacterium sp.]|uniref:D-alanyl-D-alanine carboxypeptidase family protein n=1 Tax=uncultured Corynebacterium sp. TaxID=159447 RepID=UPI00288B8AA1|nr:D-alanyl-D-alanine carboxypeptidase family protein [uncultured Corynebacterium sp.]
MLTRLTSAARLRALALPLAACLVLPVAAGPALAVEVGAAPVPAPAPAPAPAPGIAPAPPAAPGNPGPGGVSADAADAADSAGADGGESSDPAAIPTRSAAPNTDNCPNALVPPQARTTSEALAPGQAAPTPPPVTYQGPCGVSAAPGFQVPAELTASSWLIFDIDSGQIVAAKDPHGRYRPASVIKVLLAMVVLRDLNIDAVVPISEEAAGIEGSAVGVGTTGRYTTRDLLYGLLLASGNDAATALSQALGGTDVALAKVNELAQQLGATDTHVGAVTGLDSAGQMTSVTDLARFYRAAWRNPLFAQIVNTEHVDFPGYDDHPGYQVWNDNGLFMNDPDGIGGKTGYTDDANHTFVGGMDRGGRRLAAVILDTTIDKGRPWEQAQRLLNAAYALPPAAQIGSLDTPPPAPDATSEAPEAPGPAKAHTSSALSDAHGTLIGGIVAAVVIIAAIGAGVWSLRRRR